MRKTVLATMAALAILACSSFVPERADAMTAPVPAGIRAVIDGSTLAQDIAYVCRRVWRCGPYGCGWRRACWWTGPYHRRYYRRYWY